MTNTPNSGTPGLGSPSTGTPGLGTPNNGTPSTGSPDAGMPGTGTPGAGTPGTGTAGGETPGIGELEAQERRLVLPRFGFDDAWALGSLLVETARKREAPVAIDIRRGPQQLFHAALPGSTPDNDAWIDRKRRVVERYGASSYLVGARFRAKGTTFEASSRLDPDHYAAHGGSFPLAVEGSGVIGTVTVSGLPQLEDHRMVVEALERFKLEHFTLERSTGDV